VIDALCHLELFASPSDAARALDAAAKIGVTDVVSAGTDPRAKEIVPPATATRVKIHRAYGVHPENADTAAVPSLLSALEKRLDEAGVVAVGECGVDGRDGTPPMSVQRDMFTAQLWIAQRRRLPVIVHGVRAPSAVLECAQQAKVRWVWHAFGESYEIAKQAVDAGALLSVGALVLNPRARKLREALAKLDVPVMIETDAPDVDLVTLKDIAAAVAEVRGKSVDEVVAQSRKAAVDVFGLS
jgi:TatD DNase family protein